MIGMFGPMKRRAMGQPTQAMQPQTLYEPPAMQPTAQPTIQQPVYQGNDDMRVTASEWEGEEVAPKAGGMFGDPNFAGKLSAIGGMLMANAGNPMGQQLVQNYYAKQENDRQMQQRAAMAQQERMQGREDMQWEWQNKPVAPHYWESNDGSLMEATPDGGYRTVYKDETPKITWVMADDGKGGKELIPIGPNGPLNGSNPQATQPLPKASDLTPEVPTQQAPQTRENRTVNNLKRNPQGAYIVESMQDYMMIPNGGSYVDQASGKVMIKGQL